MNESIQHFRNEEVISANMLTLNEVASWSLGTKGGLINAALPSLQRGSVWKAMQAEALWDSLVRGFPIGSFLLAPYDESRGHAKFFLQKSDQPETRIRTHHLLDGQQRATAIACGFLNPWSDISSGSSDRRPVLWVDLEPTDENDDREFVFRLLTASHPWGYQRKLGAGGSERLESGQISKAIESYQETTEALKSLTPSNFPMQFVWPWDVKAPIPVSILIESVTDTEDVRAALLNKLSALPFWGVEEALCKEQLAWQTKVMSAITKEDKILSSHLERLITGIKSLVGTSSTYRIPAITISRLFGESDFGNKDVAESRDPVETLFVRVNSGGTPLAGEELMYSILKSSWPDITQYTEDVDYALTTPARQMLLIARLVQSRQQTKNDSHRPPPMLDVRGFRRLIHTNIIGKLGFSEHMRQFMEERGMKIFKVAIELLRDGEYGLPPFLISDLAQGAKGLHVMLILLRWIDRMLEAEVQPSSLDDHTKRKLLGALTAWSWFSEDAGKCLDAIWPDLQTCTPDRLSEFFDNLTFAKTLKLDNNLRFKMLPILPAAKLKEAIEECVTDRVIKNAKMSNSTSAYWSKWDRYKHWENTSPESVSSWIQRVLLKSWQAELSDEQEQMDESWQVLNYWQRFNSKALFDRRLLIFAQRKWINQWFKDFDPSIPSQVEDVNRPWDYDHIHPASLLRSKQRVLRGLPDVIKYWHGTIGNLRAWPLGLNRGDQDNSPSLKLTKPVSEMEKLYSISTEQHRWDASFINTKKHNVRAHWIATVPQEDFKSGYLVNESNINHTNCRIDLIQAITGRCLAIYEHWYDELLLAELMPSKSLFSLLRDSERDLSITTE